MLGSIALLYPQYLAVPAASATHLIPNSSDFTIEAWIYLNNYTMYNTLTSMDFASTSGTNDWFFGTNITTGQLMFGVNGTNYFTSNGPIVPLNKWCHIALTKNNNVYDVWLDGVKGSVSQTLTTNLNINGEFRVARGRSTSAHYFSGNIAAYKFNIGETLYTNNFTPPTELVKTANTRMLINPVAYDSAILDESDYAATFVRYSIPQFNSPFSYLRSPEQQPVQTLGWNTIKTLQLQAVTKSLVIADDPIIDPTIVNPDEAYETYSV